MDREEFLLLLFFFFNLIINYHLNMQFNVGIYCSDLAVISDLIESDVKL